MRKQRGLSGRRIKPDRDASGMGERSPGGQWIITKYNDVYACKCCNESIALVVNLMNGAGRGKESTEQLKLWCWPRTGESKMVSIDPP